jgi:predicted DNA-binding antitoxin AbrB/MazE fold protein
MTMTVQAVYTGGILRPAHPLALAEGATVEVTIATANGVPTPPTSSDDETLRQIQGCKTYQEWLEVTKSLPTDDGDYNILEALDENRRAGGDRPLHPDKGTPP